ncbi:PPM-type phosphatase domain-containing protein [Mycena chlorophos]|uniref:Kinetochore protein NDC80 n=1 Tax=Mycena chlorophos TaxID=658473 RepID=A0A8H6S0E1_MYCCL|nr:PPM-type phosphatase domain-containing protein [Mycena chlorophos]
MSGILQAIYDVFFPPRPEKPHVHTSAELRDIDEGYVLDHAAAVVGHPGRVLVGQKAECSRMSLAGPAQRLPQAPPSIPRQSIMPGSNPRQSIMRSQSVAQNPLLQSASKPSYARTPLNSSTRRGSVWGGGSVAPMPPSSQTLKDPRPLRDKPFQAQMKQEIHAYLRSIDYDIAPATLSNIQGKEYRAIFECLVTVLCSPMADLNPDTPLFDPKARFEDEFMAKLKALKYPFVGAIDTKALATPASMHAWPTYLGVLHWLVEACKAVAAYEESGDPTLLDTGNIPEEFDDPWDQRALAFDYFDQTYGLWLDMVDDFVEPNQELEDRYARKNERARIELDEKSQQLEDAIAELDKLKSAPPPIVGLQAEIQTLNADGNKFQKILTQYNARKNKLLDQITSEKAELSNRGKQLEQLQAEQERLDSIVKMQNLSPEEVSKMNSDHETLSQNLRDLKARIDESHRNVMTLEVNVANRGAAAEESIDVYTGLLTTLDLYPSPPPPLPDTNLTLELNTAAAVPSQLLVVGDIRGAIRPCLSAVAESKRAERAHVESERIKYDFDFDKLNTECEELEEEIAQIEKKVVGLNDQADDLREVAQQEATGASADAARLERELANARTAALANGMGVKSRLQALQFQYHEQVEKVARLKDETVRAIIKNSTDITRFKAALSKHLAELSDAAKADD